MLSPALVFVSLQAQQHNTRCTVVAGNLLSGQHHDPPVDWSLGHTSTVQDCACAVAMFLCKFRPACSLCFLVVLYKHGGPLLLQYPGAGEELLQ